MLQNESSYILSASIALQWFFWGARRSKILTGLKGEGGDFIIAGVFETLHLIKQFKQQPWAGDRVAQLQILLCGRSLEICLGISRYANTPGFLKLTSTSIQNAKLSSMFLVSPPPHSSICSILPCLTWASSQCPRLCMHRPATAQKSCSLVPD